MIHRQTEEERGTFRVRKGGQVWRISDGSRSQGAEGEKIGRWGGEKRGRRRKDDLVGEMGDRVIYEGEENV